MSNFSGVTKSNFVPRTRQEVEEMQKGAWPGEREMGATGQVNHPSTDGVVHDLSAKIKSFYTSLPKDPRLMTESEKRELYQRIIASFEAANALNDYTKQLALLLSGLKSPGDSVASPPIGDSLTQQPLGKSDDLSALIAETRQRIAVLSQRVATWAAERQGR